MSEPSSPRRGAPPSQTDRRDPDWRRVHLWQITAVRDLVWIAVAVFAVWFGYWLRAIFTPLLIALALAYLFHPLITYCQRRWRLPRPATIAILLAVLLLGGAGFGVWLGPKFTGQLVDLARSAPGYAQTLASRYDVDLGGVQEQVNTWARQVQENPGAYLFDNLRVILAGTSRAADVIGQVLGATATVALMLGLIPVYFFVFAWRFEAILRGAEPLLPAGNRREVLEVLGKMDRAVATFVRARVMIGLIMGVMFAVGWWLSGVPYWFLLGMAAGALSLIPFASAVAVPLAVGLKWLEATGGAETAEIGLWSVVLAPTLVYAVVQAVEGWVLTPVIQGQSLNMSAVTILVVVLIGGAVGGMYGLLLCVPIAACGKILLQEVLLPRLKQWAAKH